MKLKNGLHQPLSAFPRRLVAFYLLAALLVVAGAFPAPTRADSQSSDIQKKIDDTNAQIAELQKEINAYQDSLAKISTQKKTLQSELDQLDLSRKKIAANIASTQANVSKTNLELNQLSDSITDKENRVQTDQTEIAASLKLQYQSDSDTFVEHLLTGGFLDAWEESAKRAQLSGALNDHIADLETTKEALAADYAETQNHQKQLLSLQKQLTGEKSVLDQNRQDQATLLAQTKNQESQYEKLIDDKQQAILDFQKQLADYESTLNYTLDPTQVPKAGSGVLSFPVDPAYMEHCQSEKSIFGNIYCITQYFGNTAFAQSGAYNGKGHNGIDIGMPVGTKIVAALSGTVLGSGNTDLEKGCYSYGKWVLVGHDDGLATIYAHLSVISVNTGDQLETGDLIGLSGKTGYVTGPHLHFGVYVRSQVEIIKLGSVKAQTGCPNSYMPVAPTEAYLNPISYL
jgi:murein DD-endopeptidase MepM/ murein hydrolase activator NlpD